MGRIHHTPPGGSEEICFYLIFSLILLVFGPAGLPLLLLDWSGPARRFSLGLCQVFRFFLFDGSRPAGPLPSWRLWARCPGAARGSRWLLLEGTGQPGRTDSELLFPHRLNGACLLAPLSSYPNPAAAPGRGALPIGALAQYPWAAGFPLAEGLIRWPAGSRCSSCQEAGRSPCPCPLATASVLNFLAPPCWAAWHSFS